MTETQVMVYKAIKIFIDRNGYSPSIREICGMCGLSSPATVWYHLKRLKDKGFIDYKKGKNRTIVIKEDKYYGNIRETK